MQLVDMRPGQQEGSELGPKIFTLFENVSVERNILTHLYIHDTISSLRTYLPTQPPFPDTLYFRSHSHLYYSNIYIKKEICALRVYYEIIFVNYSSTYHLH